MKRKLLSVCLIIVLAFAVSMPVLALEFDAAQLGSVSVTLADPNGEGPIVGAELALYHVASVKMGDNGRLQYVYCNGFEACGVALDDPNLPRVLEQFVASHSAVPQVAVTNQQGTAVFEALPLGLYFVKQTNGVTGYAPCRSFLVTAN